MKRTMKLLVLIFGVLLLANVANAETPRERFKAMVEQLQRSPNDDALREKIIKQAQQLKPAPAIPEEAERHMAYGTAAFTGAKSLADYKEAAKEFEQATLAAPWYGDAYYNLGVAQDKAENYAAAIRNLNFARLAITDNKDIKALIYQVEYRNKKALATPKIGESFRDCPDCPEMVVIPAGGFDMGSDHGDANELPVHRVTIARPFAIGKYEVTQGEWQAIMGNNLSYYPNCGSNCPVEPVSWDDAQEFIRKLNARTGKQYRLPTEAEWEYACRAGGRQEYCGSDNVDSVAWHTKNSGSSAHPAGLKQANAFGLYDMSGSAWEWVEDGYHGNYQGAPNDGSAWQGGDGRRVLRGGAGTYVPQDAGAADRFKLEPSDQGISSGVRLARMLP